MNELTKALVEVQKQIHGAKATAKNPFFKSTYADLGDVWDSIREPLTKSGLSVTQLGSIQDGQPCLKTVLLHVSGQSLESIVPIISKPGDAQSFGSGMSYARRYALAAIVGVYQIDDDASAAVGQGATSQPQEKREVKNHAPQSKHNDPGQFSSNIVSGEFMVKFGKFKGKHIRDIPKPDLQGYVSYLEGSAGKDGKPMSAMTIEFLTAADNYLNLLDDSMPPQDGPPLESYQDSDMIPF